jgi:SAM-dependent methyltransferase
MTERTLTHEQARRVYDWIGVRQDSQSFYEDCALDRLVSHGRFASAQRVFELGCGTGRLARRLLAEHLPPDASYLGIDLSPKMVALARTRIAPFAERASVLETDGRLPLEAPSGVFDRFVSCYVLDLLPEPEIAAALEEAHRLLAPEGLLCLVGLTTGASGPSRVLARVWEVVHRIQPAWVGGCRPLDLLPFLPAERWRIDYHERVSAWAVPSEVVVAARVGNGAPPGQSA